MATLHVRGVPAGLLQRIRRLATIHGRSLNAEVIVLMYQALKEDENRPSQGQGELLAAIRQRRFVLPAVAANSAELLGEDRLR